MGDVPSDPVQVAHALVAQYLAQLGYTHTLAAFEQDAAHAGAPVPAPASLPKGLTLPSLAELYISRVRAQAARVQRKAARNPLAALLPSGETQDGNEGQPWTLAPGPVWDHIHGANILSLQAVFLPRHRFDLASSTLQTTFSCTLASTAADRRVAFTQLEGLPASGGILELQNADIRAEVVDALEGFHGGAVLAVAQPLPSGATTLGSPITCDWRTNQLPGRLLATGGMDGRVVLTDLLDSATTTPSEARKVQVLADHSKFVTRVAFSADGRFFASAGYDKQIHLYILSAPGTPFAPGAARHVPDPSAPLDAEEPLPMTGVGYTRIHTIRTGTSNPDTILFVPAQIGPGADDSADSDDEYDQEQDGETPRGEPEFYTGMGTVGGERVTGRRRRAWLVYTLRGDSDVHYIALPQQSPELEDQVAELHVDNKGRPIKDFEHIAYNTNAYRLDRHSSYSIVETSLHPSGAYLSLQTGPAESTALGLVGSEGAGGHASRIILLPLHADGMARAADLWTGVSVSSLGVTRHTWTPSGRCVIVAGEDGWLRCLDLHGRIRASTPVHGSASSDPSFMRQAHLLTDARQMILSDAPTESRERSAALMRQSLAWSRGQIGGSSGSGGNTAIRGLIALTDTCVLSAGFDRTVRLTFLSTQAEG